MLLDHSTYLIDSVILVTYFGFSSIKHHKLNISWLIFNKFDNSWSFSLLDLVCEFINNYIKLGHHNICPCVYLL